ncbi:MAG: hypothetical protein RJA70_3936 [Pseudomonadota bacterium]|jgi:predicted metal-dependent HD superfamily phosphohydrolase
MGDSKQKYAEHLSQLAQLPLVLHALQRLDTELPQELYYHSAQHTRDVFGEALLFALHDGVTAPNLELIAIAAAFHDLGYLSQYENNEPVGAALAEAAMREQGNYSEAQIEEVRGMILSTKVTAGPGGLVRTRHTDLASYVMDADWGSFGREDFFEKADQLIAETEADENEFYSRTLDLVGNHSWLTRSAGLLREAKKQENLRELRERIAARA